MHRGDEDQLYVVEVGARGSPPQSPWVLAGRVGLGPRTRDCYVDGMWEATETVSVWIWWRKDHCDLKQPELSVRMH